jgi:hypothetical protein
LAIDVFFVNKHIFFITYSTKICFSMVTHLAYREKEYIWEALLVTYNMYLRQGFHITVTSGDQEFSALNTLTTVLPTAPCLDWVAARQIKTTWHGRKYEKALAARKLLNVKNTHSGRHLYGRTTQLLAQIEKLWRQRLYSSLECIIEAKSN